MKLSKPQEYIITSPKEINLFMAGVGSGKTHLGGLISYNFIYNFPKAKGFIAANTYDQLNTSTLYRIREVWRTEFHLEENRDYVVDKQPPQGFSTEGHNFKDYNNIISFKNGAIIFLGSLDNAKPHEGKEFSWAILDETKDTAEEDVKEIILMRLRGGNIEINGKITNPLYILTSPAKVDWINKWFKLDDDQVEIQKKIYSDKDFFNKEFDNKCVSVSSTFHNLINLPPNYIENKKFDLTKEQFERLIYGDPFQRTGGEYFSTFDRAKHIGDCTYKEGYPLHLSFDQNVVPYNTCLVFQIINEDEIYYVNQIDEICLENPKNSTENLCEEFMNRYSPQAIFVYGDTTGKNRDTKGKGSDYDVIKRTLYNYITNTSFRVPSKNMSVSKRRDFMNNMFEEKFNIQYVVNKKCVHTIDDFLYLKQDIDGGKLKKVVKDKRTGESYQKYGHCADASEYMFCEAFKSYIK